jgi:hypothetical protein
MPIADSVLIAVAARDTCEADLGLAQVTRLRGRAIRRTHTGALAESLLKLILD